MSDHFDQELIDAALSGSHEAFDALIRRYQSRLVHSLEYALGSREDALDAAQLAFVSVWKNLSGFRRKAAFYSWLYRIALNAARTSRRRQRVDTGSLDTLQEYGDLAQDLSPSSKPELVATAAERVELVQRALQSIATEFRQPLVLREIDGMSYDEIAVAMEIPVGTVRSRIFRARQELTQRLNHLMPDEW